MLAGVLAASVYWRADDCDRVNSILNGRISRGRPEVETAEACVAPVQTSGAVAFGLSRASGWLRYRHHHQFSDRPRRAALFILRIIDHTIPDHDAGELDLLIAILFAIILVGAVNEMVQGWLGSVISQNVMHDLRIRLYERMSTLSIGWFSANRSGETLSRVTNDVAAIDGVIRQTLSTIVGNFITLTTTFALMLFLDWRLALLSLLFIPLFALPAQRAGNSQRVLQGESQSKIASLNSQMQETLSVSGVLLMRTFGRQAGRGGPFRDVADAVEAAEHPPRPGGALVHDGDGPFRRAGPGRRLLVRRPPRHGRRGDARHRRGAGRASCRVCSNRRRSCSTSTSRC